MSEPGTRKGPGSLCVNPHLFIPAAGRSFRARASGISEYR